MEKLFEINQILPFLVIKNYNIQSWEYACHHRSIKRAKRDKCLPKNQRFRMWM